MVPSRLGSHSEGGSVGEVRHQESGRSRDLRVGTGTNQSSEDSGDPTEREKDANECDE